MVADYRKIGPGKGVCASGKVNISSLKFEATQYSVEKALNFVVGFKLQAKVLLSREFLVLLLV